MQKVQLNDAFFNSPNINNSYWAGFIAADGCITRGRVQIEINSTDTEHLKGFLRDSGCNANIYHSERSNSVKISPRAEQWVNDLNDNFNIGPRKSLTLEPPKGLNKSQIKAYITGYIDGDGSWYYAGSGNWKYLTLGVVGTEPFLNWMSEHLNGNTSIYAEDSYFRLRSFGSTAHGIHMQLWNPRLPLLERKWGKNYKIWNG